jgi:hypothetical protein
VERTAPVDTTETSAGAGTAGAPAVPGPPATPGPGWLAVALLAVNLPIVVATVRALARGWQPLGDNGLMLVRARDVGTAHHPLLGLWSSASLLFDKDLNHPGPLYFDVLALPVRLLGPWVGLAVGVMLVNMAAATLAVVVARRVGGVRALVAVAAAVVGLQWAMGSELLFDVWQPNALVLPMMALLVVAVALAGGDLPMAPWFVGVGSLLAQTHVSYLPLVAALAAGTAVLAGLSVRRSPERVAWRAPLALAVVVGVLAWVQPVVEQVTSDGEGNLSRLARAAVADGQDAIGAGRALRIMAEVLTGPWYARASYESAVPITAPDAPIQGLLAPSAALVVLSLTVVVLAGLVLAGRRTGCRPLATMAVVAVAALVTGLVTLASSPVNITGVAVHGMRWLWPIAALVTATVLYGVLVLLRSGPGVARVGAPALVLGLALAVAAGNLATYHSRSWGPVLTAPELPAAQELAAGLDAIEGRGTVLVDVAGVRYGEPYTGLLLAEMQDRGIPFVLDNEGMIRQVGEGRRYDGHAELRLWHAEGEAAGRRPPGAELLASSDEGPLAVALFVEPIG